MGAALAAIEAGNAGLNCARDFDPMTRERFLAGALLRVAAAELERAGVAGPAAR